MVSLLRPGDLLDETATAGICTELIGIDQPPRSLARRLKQEAAALPTRRPILAQQLQSSALVEAAVRAVEAYRPDVVHLEPGWAAEIATALPRDVPTVLATLDAWYLNWRAEARQTERLGRKLRVHREAARMRRFEGRMYARCDAVVVVTERDAAVLRQLDHRLEPAVVTNGVDAEAFRRPSGTARQKDLVVFTGAMGYSPNVDAAEFAAKSVMPRLRKLVPEARLQIVGRDPAPAVKSLSGPFVEVTGTVPDLRPWLWSAGAYLCPMRIGTGVKNKLLEAMAAGCPCVVTTNASAGLALRDGVDALVRDDADGLAEALGNILSDDRTADQLVLAATERARELSWDATAAGYEDVYASVIERKSTTRPHRG